MSICPEEKKLENVPENKILINQNYEDLRRRLAVLLMEKSYREGDFVLASGRKSDYYFDCRVTSLTADGAWLMGMLFNNILENADIAGIGGMSMGADPLVTATSMLSRSRGKGVLNALYVRKEPKDHGRGRQVEGMDNFRPGDRIAVLEDVVTTGGSLLKACKALEKERLVITECCVILDREEGGAEAIREAGYKFTPVFTRKELVASGK